MQIVVKGQHSHVPEAIKERAATKLEKVERFFPRILNLEIEFHKNGRATIVRHKVSVTATAKQHILRASASGPDPLTAVDKVMDKLETQVRRLKGKVTRKGRASGPGAPSIRTSS